MFWWLDLEIPLHVTRFSIDLLQLLYSIDLDIHCRKSSPTAKLQHTADSHKLLPLLKYR